MFSVFFDCAVDRQINFLPLDTSTKHTGLETGCMSFFTKFPLPLSRLETRIGFVDDIKSTAPSDNLAIRVSIFESLNG